jgi:hypothetical protein
MNAGTCWGKNTIGPRGQSAEKAPGSDFTFTLPDPGRKKKFLSCKANATVQLAKTGHGPHSSQIGDNFYAVSSMIILI